jgi:hypothetical protein
MNAGLEAVQKAITAQFGVGIEDMVFISQESPGIPGISFEAAGRPFSVYVTPEWGSNLKLYKVDLSQLRSKLDASKNGKVTVKTSGICPD